MVNSASGTKVLWDAIESCPPLTLGRNYGLKSKEVWALVTNNTALPEANTKPVKGRPSLCKCVKKLLQWYGFEYLYKVRTASSPPGASDSRPARRRRAYPGQEVRL